MALHDLAQVRPGCWAALGENTLYDVRYVPEPGGRSIQTIMTAWSGAAFNNDSNQLWIHGGEGAGFLSSFDQNVGRWTPYGDSMTDNLAGCYRTAAIDPAHDMFVAINIGDDSLWAWNIAAGIPGGEIEGIRLNMTGDTAILTATGAPGLERYDLFMGVNSVYEPVFFFRLPD